MPLEFKDLETDQRHELFVGALEVEVTTPDGQPCKGVAYVLTLPDGRKLQGKLDQQGRLRAPGVGPGQSATLELVGIPLLALAEQAQG